MKNFLAVAAACASIITLSACAESESETDTVPITGEVNLYSSRHYDTDLALYEDFTRTTGIKVNRIEADADALIERIQSEGEFSPADIFVTVDAGRLWRARAGGHSRSDAIRDPFRTHPRKPAPPRWLVVRPVDPRADRHLQQGARRAAGLANYADLANPAFKGDICVRSSSNIYNISLLSSIVAHSGSADAEAWAKGVVANFKQAPQGNDTAMIEAVAAGQCRISVVNTYYLARYVGGDTSQRAIFDKVGVIFPDQAGAGTHVNISGAGVVKTAPNRENAVKFLEYLTSESAQRYLADGNNEYPAVVGLKANSAVERLGVFKADTLNAAEIGRNQAEAVKIFDRAGWN